LTYINYCLMCEGLGCKVAFVGRN